MVDFDSALSMCGLELIDILCKWFGLCNRWVSFYKHFGSIYCYHGSQESVPYYPERGFGFMYSLMNLFGDLRGIEAISEFILDGNPELGNTVIPIVYMNKTLQSIKYFYQRWNNNLSSEISEIAKNAITNRIDNLTDREIRDINTNEITSILETLKLYLARKSNYKIVEQLELSIARNLLNSK